MTTRRDPEQRSTAGHPAPGQSAAIPTGNEVYKRNPAGNHRAGGPEAVLPASGTITDEEVQASMTRLSELAAGYYDRLGETARQLTEQASSVYDAGRGYLRESPGGSIVGAFVVGVIVGVLMDRE